MNAPSVRQVAEACGCSTATVSRALAGSALVRPERVKRIQRVAKKLGYVRNPLVGSVMAQLRGRERGRLKGNLAMIHVQTAGQRELLPFQREMFEGARRRAAELGFSLELFALGTEGLGAQALARILRARGVVGLVMIHFRQPADLAAFPWDQFAVVEIDYSLRELVLDTVMLDHHMTLTVALDRLAELGYKRGGLFLERLKDGRIRHKWAGAFLAFQDATGTFGRVPIFRFEQIEEDKFMRWFEKHRPDVLIGHQDRALGWLEGRGVKVPRDVGYLSLNWRERGRACAGLDLVPNSQGAAAVETVVSHVIGSRRGLPVEPRSVMIAGRWVKGPTLREQGGTAEGLKS